MSFQHYSGPASSFPGKDTWKDFVTLFNINKPTMQRTGDSGEDIGRIFNAINDASKIGVEERVILCIIMQESRGNVGVGTPQDQDHNNTGGLMQAEESPGFPGQHNLSQDQISAMVTAGTKHFKGNLEQLDNADTASTIYRALRLYNSGSINEANLSDGKEQRIRMSATLQTASRDGPMVDSRAMWANVAEFVGEGAVSMMDISEM